jgi:hypothetical protein
MACFSPIQAFRNPYDSNGPLIFSSHTIGSHDVAVGVYGLKIPCGQFGLFKENPIGEIITKDKGMIMRTTGQVTIFTTMKKPNLQRTNSLTQPLHKFLKMLKSPNPVTYLLLNC